MTRAIVTAPGSLGDVNPLLAIARALHAQGVEVIFAAAERYLPLAEQAGLNTHILTTEERFGKLVSDPRIWQPRHGARMIFSQAVGDFLEPHFEWLRTNCNPKNTIFVSHILDLAGRTFRDRYPETRFVSVVPAPAVFRSSTSPPKISGFRFERMIPKVTRPVVYPIVYRAADWWLDRIAGPKLNRLRKREGLPKIKRILNQWWMSPDLVLGLFPDWFSIPKADLPSAFVHTGFPLADSADLVPPKASAELQSILDRLGGRRPVVFAPGTAHHHAGNFLEAAAETCTNLGQPGILLSTNHDQIPRKLPPNVFAAGYLPFSQLLANASAIVHHGGVGTTSQAFAAGIPQTIVPMAFDQFDNAERVQQLGCGNSLPMRRVNQARLTRLVDATLRESKSVHSIRDRVIASRFDGKNIADQILGLN